MTDATATQAEPIGDEALEVLDAVQRRVLWLRNHSAFGDGTASIQGIGNMCNACPTRKVINGR